jgi:osmotically inducible protein OsmC
MATAERRANVVWRGNLQKGSGILDLASSQALTGAEISFPARTEKPDGKTSPEELIAGAHAGCYAMALSNVLNEGGNAPEQLDVSATVTLDMGSLKVTTSRLEVRGRVSGLDQSGFEEAARQAEQLCPVSNALRNNVEIQLNPTLES